MLVKVPGKDTATVVAALSQHVRQLPATVRCSLTWDRGLEWPSTKASRWRRMYRFTSAICKVPGSAASNENTNGLLRQYLPKKADLSCYSQTTLFSETDPLPKGR
jgi:transposase, IS30 family